MGQEASNQINILTEDELQLVDFIYLDVPRLDSYISQIQNGTLRSVTKTVGTNQGSSFNSKTGISAGVKAEISYGSNETSTENATESYDPFHSKFIDLFNRLNLSPIRFNREYTAQLGIIESKAIIRDLKSMAAILPVIANGKNIIPGIDNVTRAQLKSMGSLLEALNPSIDLTLSTPDGSISGTLKSEYLSISISDIVKNYGNNLPGKWFTIGIFDSPMHDLTATDTPDSLEGVIDMYNIAINSIYRFADLRVSPLAIFRTLTI